jgi:hypothetical protein
VPRSSAGVGRPRRGSPRREQPAPRAWRGPGVFASRCCGYTPRRSEIAGWVLQRQDRAMPPTPARWCARKIGAAWAARTEKDVPSSPCSTPVYAAGETTTATARIGGTTVPGTSCHARASSCRSRCSRTGTTRSSSDPIAAPSAPVRPNRGMHPGTHRRHRSVPGHRRPRCPRLGSNLGRQRHRPGCSIHRLQRFRSP